MGRKHNVSTALFADNANMSAPLLSKEIQTSEMDKGSIHVAWTAGPVGTFAVEVQNGPKDSWYELSFGAVLTISSADDGMQLVLNEMPFTQLRLRYTPTSGSSVVSAQLNVKNVGA